MKPDSQVQTYQKLVSEFKFMFETMKDGEGINLINEVQTTDGVAFEVELAKGLDARNISTYINGRYYIVPAISLEHYEDFLKSQRLPVVPGYLTFRAYPENGKVYLRLFDGKPFRMGY